MGARIVSAPSLKKLGVYVSPKARFLAASSVISASPCWIRSFRGDQRQRRPALEANVTAGTGRSFAEGAAALEPPVAWSVRDIVVALGLAAV